MVRSPAGLFATTPNVKAPGTDLPAADGLHWKRVFGSPPKITRRSNHPDTVQ